MGGTLATILAIEDDPSFRDLLKLHLQFAGHTLRGAADPEEGLRAILEEPPDLILLDLDLPYLSGFEVLQALKSDRASRGIPVVIITGRPDGEAYERCRKIGFEGFASKPLKREDLLGVVNKALDARTGKRRGR
ncbi:MAG TPA: response regulator [Burkholderiales bacterium]|nr:response regulator [Burkholderiales bacterium]